MPLWRRKKESGNRLHVHLCVERAEASEQGKLSVNCALERAPPLDLNCLPFPWIHDHEKLPGRIRVWNEAPVLQTLGRDANGEGALRRSETETPLC